MSAGCAVETVAPSPFAFRLEPRTVRMLVPPGTCGTYMMFDEESNSLYVGRSDTCLRRRLESHPLIGIAAYVMWWPAESPVSAFHLEAYWYHRYAFKLLNKVHPAKPVGFAGECPFCMADLESALEHAWCSHHQIGDPQ